MSGFLEFRDLPGYSRILSFSCSLCFFHNLLIPFSLFPKLQGGTEQRGYGGRLRSPPQLADASLKRATDVAQTNEKSCFHIQKQLEPFFFFLSFSFFLLYPIYGLVICSKFPRLVSQCLQRSLFQDVYMVQQ